MSFLSAITAISADTRRMGFRFVIFFSLKRVDKFNVSNGDMYAFLYFVFCSSWDSRKETRYSRYSMFYDSCNLFIEISLVNPCFDISIFDIYIPRPLF